MRFALCSLLLFSLIGCQAQTSPPKNKATDETSAPDTPPPQTAIPEAGSTVAPIKNPGPTVVTWDEYKDAADDPQVDIVAMGIMEKPIYTYAAKTVTYSPDGKLIATGTGEGQIHLYDTQSGELTRSIQAHQNWAFDLLFTKDSKKLYSGGGDNTTKVWDVATGEVLQTYEDHQEDVHGVGLAEDETLVITGADDMQVLIRNLKDDSVEVLGTHDKQVTGISISPDGKLVASSSRDGTVKLWEIQSRKELRTLEGHKKDVLAATFSSDSKFLVTASNDKTAAIWDVSSGEKLESFALKAWGHTAVFSPDNKTIYVGSADGKLRRFKRGNPNPIALLIEPSDIADLAFSPNGKELAVVTAHGDLVRLSIQRTQLPRKPVEKPKSE